jgi:hypothetical protein
MTELVATFIGKPMSEDVHPPDRSVRKHLKLIGTHVDLRDTMLLQRVCHSRTPAQSAKQAGKYGCERRLISESPCPFGHAQPTSYPIGYSRSSRATFSGA